MSHPHSGMKIHPNSREHLARKWKAYIIAIMWKDGSSSYYLRFYSTPAALQRAMKAYLKRQGAVEVEVKSTLSLDDARDMWVDTV